VDFNQRLTEIYEAIFDYDKSNSYQKEIGLMTFDKNSKAWLLNVINLFSLQIEF
jgi:hypothetical protein